MGASRTQAKKFFASVRHQRWAVVFLVFMQAVCIVLLGVFGRYDETADASYSGSGIASTGVDPLVQYYPMFQDVNVMIFVGFPFLVSFLKRHGLSSSGVNMLLAAFSIQWSTVVHGITKMVEHNDSYFKLHVKFMTTSLFSTAAILVSWCVVLGRTNIFQLGIMAFIEVIVQHLNEHLLVHYLKISDIGGSILVHVFGAYFGLAASRILYAQDITKCKKEEAVYHSEMFAFIGTAFLWVFWPSFNSAMGEGNFRHRAIINSFYAMCACSVTVYITSIFCDKEAKATPAYSENATLAGGVAVGAMADLMIQPYGAVLVGAIGGFVSTIGFKYVQPYILIRFKIHDTCGVHNLHAMPGIVAAIGSAIAAAVATEDMYQGSLYTLYPAMAPTVNTTQLHILQQTYPDSGIKPGYGRSPLDQGAYQILALVITLLISVIGGVITGMILKLKFFDPPKGDNMFEDGILWNMHHDGIPAFEPIDIDSHEHDDTSSISSA